MGEPEYSKCQHLAKSFYIPKPSTGPMVESGSIDNASSIGFDLLAKASDMRDRATVPISHALNASTVVSEGGRAQRATNDLRLEPSFLAAKRARTADQRRDNFLDYCPQPNGIRLSCWFEGPRTFEDKPVRTQENDAVSSNTSDLRSMDQLSVKNPLVHSPRPFEGDLASPLERREKTVLNQVEQIYE